MNNAQKRLNKIRECGFSVDSDIFINAKEEVRRTSRVHRNLRDTIVKETEKVAWNTWIDEMKNQPLEAWQKLKLISGRTSSGKPSKSRASFPAEPTHIGIATMLL